MNISILELNYDHFEAMFQWITLKDLLRIRLTSKQFKLHADTYIRAKYPKFNLDYARVVIYETSCIDRILNMSPDFIKTIKKITFAGVVLQSKDTNQRQFKAILSQIETLEMKGARIESEFYTLLLRNCSKLRHLIISGIDDAVIIGTDNTWLRRIYPNLESMHLDNIDVDADVTYGDGESVPELAQFIQANPSVHTFSTSYDWFEANCKNLLRGNATFNKLKIQAPIQPCQIDAYICNRLRKLHARGGYQHLHLSNVEIKSQEDLDLIAAIPAIEVLFVDEAQCVITLPDWMTTLQKIGFRHASELRNPVLLAKHLMNVDGIYFESATSRDDILSFVRYSNNMQVLYVKHFGQDAIDVIALNKEREKLENPRNLTIYMEEDVYLATKHAFQTTKHSLIELKNVESSNSDIRNFSF